MRNEKYNSKELIEYLQGTCKTLDEGVETLFEGMEQDDLTEDDLWEIEQEIFRCDICGWWYDISEDSGTGDSEMICNECAE